MAHRNHVIPITAEAFYSLKLASPVPRTSPPQSSTHLRDRTFVLKTIIEHKRIPEKRTVTYPGFDMATVTNEDIQGELLL